MKRSQPSSYTQPRRAAARVLLAIACLLGGMGLAAGQASAHVVYGDDLNVNGNQNNYVSSNAGWLAGQNATTQTDSHLNRFFKFELTETSTVNFSISAINGFQYVPFGSTTIVTALDDLNPGYSLFSPIAASLSHDGAPYPGQTPFATWSPFALPHDDQPKAPTDPSSQKWKKYRSNADFTMANDLNEAPTSHFIADDGTSTGNSISGSYVLGPGIYNLVVVGNNQTNLDTVFSNVVASNGCGTAGAACDAYTAARIGRGFNIQFTAAPVPVPAAVYLFGSGLVGLAGLARRKMKASA
ncbi:MAG: hypothetical protein IPK92_19900 [Nitrospira sp.]|nr:hypothetical protein [Nitrospira sp.]